MLILSQGNPLISDVITWLYIDAVKIDLDISVDVARYRRVEHDTWPLNPKRTSAAALDKVIEEIKRK